MSKGSFLSLLRAQEPWKFKWKHCPSTARIFTYSCIIQKSNQFDAFSFGPIFFPSRECQISNLDTTKTQQVIAIFFTLFTTFRLERNVFVGVAIWWQWRICCLIIFFFVDSVQCARACLRNARKRRQGKTHTDNRPAVSQRADHSHSTYYI